MLPLTEPFSCPPVRFFDYGKAHFRMQSKSVIQISSPTLWLSYYVEVRKTAEAVMFTAVVVQMFPNYLSQVIKCHLEMLCV